MALIARIIGTSLLTAALGAWLGFALFKQYGDCTFAELLLGCVGSIIGAIAGAAREIVARQTSGQSAGAPADSN